MGLLDLFIMRDDGAAEQPSAQPSQQPITNMPTSSANQAGSGLFKQKHVEETPATELRQSAVMGDENIKQKLLQYIVEHNLPGPDYLEVKNDAANLSKFIHDESGQYAAAFEVLKGRYPDFTKEKILTSIDKYKMMMESERKNGLEEAKQALAEADNSSEISSLLAEANKLEADIAKMTAELEEKRRLADSKQKEMDNKKFGIEQGMAVFNASVNEVIGILESDKQKISALKI